MTLAQVLARADRRARAAVRAEPMKDYEATRGSLRRAATTLWNIDQRNARADRAVSAIMGQYVLGPDRGPRSLSGTPRA